MSYTPAIRNRDDIQFADLRKAVDPDFEKLHDSLSAAYYDYWREGKLYPWQGYNVQSTPKESKILFDRLHGLIFIERHQKFHTENLKLAVKEQIPVEKYDSITNDIGTITGSKFTENEIKLTAEKVEGFEIDTKATAIAAIG